MLSWLFCGCCCKSNRSQQDHTNNDINNHNNDHVIVTIDGLEIMIRQYAEFEENAIQQLGQELVSLLPELVEFPEHFVDCNNLVIQELAKKRVYLYELQQRLASTTLIDDDGDTNSDAGMSAISDEPISNQVTSDGVSVSDNENTRMSIMSQFNDIHHFDKRKVADRLSKNWAANLANVSSTQGYMRQIVKSDGSKLLMIKPQWPEWLVDEIFEVQKVNRRGMMYPRQLRLTEFHILGVRNGNEITKIHTYKEVSKVSCITKGKVPQVVIEFTNGIQFKLATPLASYIAQQVSTRIHVTNDLESQNIAISLAGRISRENSNSQVLSRDLAREISRHSSGLRASGLGASSMSARSDGSQRGSTTNPLASIGVPTVLSGSVPHATQQQNADVAYYSVDAVRSMILAISEDNAKSVSSVVVNFAASLRDRIVAKSLMRARAISPSNSSSAIKLQSNALHAHSMSPTSGKQATSLIGINTVTTNPATSKSEQHKAQSRLARRLVAVEPRSAESVLQEEIRRLLFDSHVEEGSTRSAFLEDWMNANGIAASTSTGYSPPPIISAVGSGNLSGLLKLRQWVEGMHQYIITMRGCVLTSLYLRAHVDIQEQIDRRSIDSGRAPLAVAASPINSSRSLLGVQTPISVPTTASAVTSPVPHVLMSDPLLSDRAELAVPISLSVADQDALLVVCYLAYVVVEESVYSPLQTRIVELLPGTMLEDKRIVEKMAILSQRSQRQMGISSDHSSSLQWSAAAFELSGIERNPTPTLKLQAVLRTAKSIMSEYSKEVLMRANSRQNSNATSSMSTSVGSTATSVTTRTSISSAIGSGIRMSTTDGGSTLQEEPSLGLLSADELLPIFIFVLCRSRLTTPLRNKELLWSLCHPDLLHGEPGYYLTIYESAVTFVQEFDVEKPVAN